jgi:hypothetical protein
MSKMTAKQRTRKLENCGKHAFLDCCGRKAQLRGHPRYPITAPGSCEVGSTALHNAYKRARQQHEWTLADKAVALGKRLGFAWAKAL